MVTMAPASVAVVMAADVPMVVAPSPPPATVSVTADAAVSAMPPRTAVVAVVLFVIVSAPVPLKVIRPLTATLLLYCNGANGSPMLTKPLKPLLLIASVVLALPVIRPVTTSPALFADCNAPVAAELLWLMVVAPEVRLNEPSVTMPMPLVALVMVAPAEVMVLSKSVPTELLPWTVMVRALAVIGALTVNSVALVLLMLTLTVPPSVMALPALPTVRVPSPVKVSAMVTVPAPLKVMAPLRLTLLTPAPATVMLLAPAASGALKVNSPVPTPRLLMVRLPDSVTVPVLMVVAEVLPFWKLMVLVAPAKVMPPVIESAADAVGFRNSVVTPPEAVSATAPPTVILPGPARVRAAVLPPPMAELTTRLAVKPAVS